MFIEFDRGVRSKRGRRRKDLCSVHRLRASTSQEAAQSSDDSRRQVGEMVSSWDRGDGTVPTVYPIEQPHPSTKAYDPQWDKEIKALGPVGLIIEATIWSGLVLDSSMRIWQQREWPVDIMKTPYQDLKQ